MRCLAPTAPELYCSNHRYLPARHHSLIILLFGTSLRRRVPGCRLAATVKMHCSTYCKAASSAHFPRLLRPKPEHCALGTGLAATQQLLARRTSVWVGFVGLVLSPPTARPATPEWNCPGLSAPNSSLVVASGECCNAVAQRLGRIFADCLPHLILNAPTDPLQPVQWKKPEPGAPSNEVEFFRCAPLGLDQTFQIIPNEPDATGLAVTSCEATAMLLNTALDIAPGNRAVAPGKWRQ